MCVTIHCDGACSGNPGPGGYGVVLKYRNHRKELSGGFRKTTNNRMELLAAIKGLLELKKDNCDVKLISDSKYLVDAVTKGWLENWKSRRWRNSKKEVVKNIDLWFCLDELLSKHNVELVWIKGHSGDVENSRCDDLAVEARQKDNLPYDEPYEAFQQLYLEIEMENMEE